MGHKVGGDSVIICPKVRAAKPSPSMRLMFYWHRCFIHCSCWIFLPLKDGRYCSGSNMGSFHKDELRVLQTVLLISQGSVFQTWPVLPDSGVFSQSEAGRGNTELEKNQRRCFWTFHVYIYKMAAKERTFSSSCPLSFLQILHYAVKWVWIGL